jgi:hydrogenase-4 component B
MVLVVIARDGVLFLVGWELASLSAFFAISADDRAAEVREAGFLYLVCTRLSALCLIGAFALLYASTGSFRFADFARAELSEAHATAVFALALVGCALKAGVMPFHVWLPGAHAAAPSHVSAVLSGVVIKLGVYGLARVVSFFAEVPLGFGVAVFALGVASAVLGVAFALAQHDLKRLLAYHSIENVGIIWMGLGLALLGASTGHASWLVLGAAGGLFHVWNHALFKALLFLGAGSVVHATGTRELDHLGGLAKPMPRTAFLFLVGAVAISGLPPLNGFASEFLVYSGMLRSALAPGPLWLLVALAVPALAWTGALALACFVKVVGSVFLGEPRSDEARRAHEAAPSMLAPMGALALACAVLGIAPALVAPALDAAIASVFPAEVAPLGALARASAVLVVLLAAGALVLRWRLRAAPRDTGPTWDCGYAAPAPRMQYTASSFAQIITSSFGWALRPIVHWPRVDALFARPARFHSEVPDAVLEHAVLPAVRRTERVFAALRWLQQGRTHVYVLYVLLALLALLAPLGAGS